MRKIISFYFLLILLSGCAYTHTIYTTYNLDDKIVSITVEKSGSSYTTVTVKMTHDMFSKTFRTLNDAIIYSKQFNLINTETIDYSYSDSTNYNQFHYILNILNNKKQ